MKVTVIIIASFIATACIAQEAATKPSLSMAQAAEIAQRTLEAEKLPPEFYLRSILVTTKPGYPMEAIYEASFEPPKDAETTTKPEQPLPIRWRVIVVDMQGKGTIEVREVSPRIIRRRVIQ